MDPMSEFEENLKKKYEFERKELLDTIILNDLILARDFNGKGKEVHPTGKQRKIVQTIAQTINFNITTSKEDNENVIYFDLNAKPRTFISSGMINKLEPDNILRKFSRRFLFIFNDVLLLTSKKETSEFFEVKQVLWISELRIKHKITSINYDTTSSSTQGMNNNTTTTTTTTTTEDPFCFELFTIKNQKKSIVLSCEDEVTKFGWINDIENTLLAYHRETELSKQLGWFHEIIQGTIYSAAYLGDSILLRRHLNAIHKPKRHSIDQETGANFIAATIDSPDKSGMAALHWAVLRGHEVCSRLLLDRGADVDAYQKGLNTPLLLAAVSNNNSETLVRLLLERGANLYARNMKDHDIIFMAVLYGHSSKGLPWLFQLLNSKGLDLNAPDGVGATPLHLCAKRNLARPIRMLVDSGADVNAKHGTTQLTPLQLACANIDPDVETIRSFLDKGAYVNWRDLEGRTAFDIVLHSQQKSQQNLTQQVPAFSIRDSFNTPMEELPTLDEFRGDFGSIDDDNVITRKATFTKLTTSPPKSFKAFGKSTFTSGRYSLGATQSSKKNNFEPEKIENESAGELAVSQQRWRAMETTIKQVGDWAVRALPVLLEICKRGGRCRPQQDPLLQSLRPSFRAALEEAQDIWNKLKQPTNFIEFVLVREQSGEDLRLHKANWIKDNHSSLCQLCSESFSLRVRRHHCRACGVLTCDDCSSKRLILSATSIINNYSNNAIHFPSSKKNNEDNNNEYERVCDGCYNRLCHEASQPSPDNFRVKQLKRCALDVIACMEELVRALDDPNATKSDSFSFTIVNNNEINDLNQLLAQTNCNSSNNNNNSNRISKMKSSKNGSGAPTLDQIGSRKSINGLNISIRKEESLIELLKFREAKVKKSEDIVAKFLEATDAYHKVTKKLIEQKIASNRLWGNSDI